MERNGEIARISLDPKTNEILAVTVFEENLRFKCKRCATFCCTLGGPKLTKKDIQRIENAGYHTREFFTPLEGKSTVLHTLMGYLKSEEDGSCIFLRSSPDKGSCECSIYDSRPALCKLYPFDFCNTDSQSIALRLIPCCRGLNNPDGELVDERFIVGSLLDAIFDLIS